MMRFPFLRRDRTSCGRVPDRRAISARAILAGCGTAAASLVALAAPLAAQAPDGAAVQELTMVGTVIRWLFHLSIVVMGGSVAFRMLVLPQLGRAGRFQDAERRAARRTWMLAWGGGILGLVVLPARLWDASVRMYGGDALGSANLADLLFRSAWGIGWILGVLAVLLFLFGAFWSRPEGRGWRGWIVMAGAALVLTAVPGISGHAAAVDTLAPLSVLNDALHVVAASAWIGGLAALLLAGLPAVRRSPEEDRTAGVLYHLVEASSRVALGAVTLVVGTGLINAWIHLGSIGELVTTAYGRTLLVKLAVTAAALALWFYNWKNVRPSLRESPRPGLLRIPASLELLLGLGVLAVTAYLSAVALPG